MVKLTRIYTRTGDDGTTGLGDFSRVPKTDLRLAAYADVSEANAALGVAVAIAELRHDGDHEERLLVSLRRIQNDMFDVGADLSMPLTSHPGPHGAEPLRVKAEWIEELEVDCDVFNANLAPLKSFVLPGGTMLAARLHVAATIVRRAERSVWAAIEEYGTEPTANTEEEPGGVNILAAHYLNRLSDLVFIMARHANHARGDVLWVPGGGRG